MNRVFDELVIENIGIYDDFVLIDTLSLILSILLSNSVMYSESYTVIFKHLG